MEVKVTSLVLTTRVTGSNPVGSTILHSEKLRMADHYGCTLGLTAPARDHHPPRYTSGWFGLSHNLW